MFWGVTLENGKRYSQVVDMPVCITMASLEPSTVGATKAVSVMIEHEKSEFLLCTLIQDKFPQQTLDLQFVEGEEVTFFLNGQGIVHLTGYSAEGDDHEMDGSEEGDSEEDSSIELDDDELEALVREKDTLEKSMKRKLLNQSPKNAKKIKADSDDDDDDDDDEEDEDDSDSDSDEDDENLFVKMPTKGKGKELQQQTPKKSPGQKDKPLKPEIQTPKTPKGGQGVVKVTGQQTPKTPAVNGSTPGSESESGKKKRRRKKKSKTPEKSSETPNIQSQQKTPAAKGGKSEGEPKTQATATPKKGAVHKLPGGVTIEEKVVGNGPVAKSGSTIQVYYKGTLTNGKEFDSKLSGNPFRVHLGKGEVVKGWEVGLQGMKVGGNRRIVIPPSQAYGDKAVGTIPPNSTLIFDIRLISVK